MLLCFTNSFCTDVRRVGFFLRYKKLSLNNIIIKSKIKVLKTFLNKTSFFICLQIAIATDQSKQSVLSIGSKCYFNYLFYYKNYSYKFVLNI